MFVLALGTAVLGAAGHVAGRVTTTRGLTRRLAVVLGWAWLGGFAGYGLLIGVLAVAGVHLERLRVRRVKARPAAEGAWSRLAWWVMRRPVAVLIPTLALLLALVHRVVVVFRTSERDELAAGDAQHEADLEAERRADQEEAG